MPGLQLDAVATDSHVIQDSKFHAAWMVGPNSCGLNWISPVNTAVQNRLLKQKWTSILFIVFDNFIKVTPCSACLLIWNMKAIFRISIKNSITYPKHSQIHFLVGTLFFLVLFLARHNITLEPLWYRNPAALERKSTLAPEKLDENPIVNTEQQTRLKILSWSNSFSVLSFFSLHNLCKESFCTLLHALLLLVSRCKEGKWLW